MHLTPYDVGTPLWGKLCAHYEPILAKLRARAENPELAEAERLPILYYAKFIKEFLEMAEPPKGKVTGAS